MTKGKLCARPRASVLWAVPGRGACSVLAVATILCSLSSPGAQTMSAFSPFSYDSDLSLYFGTYTDTRLLDIVTRGETAYRPSHILTAAVSRPTGSELDSVLFETEAQVVKHFGIMQHLEVNGLLIARWPSFLGLPISLAVGEGLSLAGENPSLENPRKDLLHPFRTEEESRPLLNYLMVELELKPESTLNLPRMFLRVHHRSGVFGTYCPPTCGSNFVAYGIRLPVQSLSGMFQKQSGTASRDRSLGW